MKNAYMEAMEAKGILMEVFGAGYQTRAYEALGVTRATINRWCCGLAPIGPMESKLLLVIQAMHRMGMDWRKYIAANPMPALPSAVLDTQGVNAADELI